MRRMKTDRLRSGALTGQEDVKKLIWLKFHGFGLKQDRRN
jgi:hypothetical protein